MCQPLFDTMGEVEGRILQAPHLLLCLAYDGTLAPLVDEPAMAYLPPHVERVLRSLAEHERVSIAVLSGRERADLQAHVGLPGLIYAGNHGLEISGPGFLFVEPAAAACREQLQALAADLNNRLQAVAGVQVEDKGLTISVHYRQVEADEREEVRRLVHAALANTSHPFVLTLGEKVYEIRPRVYWDKGSAVLCIQSQFGRPGTLTVYVGDDETDEDAFTALPDAITIKVDGPSETAARYLLDGPAEVRRFLEWVESLLHQEAGGVPGRGVAGARELKT
jgi:trehalose 6-phosphate phosphatase